MIPLTVMVETITAELTDKIIMVPITDIETDMATDMEEIDMKIIMETMNMEMTTMDVSIILFAMVTTIQY